MKRLNQFRTDVGRMRSLWRLEKQQVAPKMRPDLWARGFLSDKGWLYPGVDVKRHTYLSDWQIESQPYRHLNGDSVRRLLQDKFASDFFFRERGLVNSLPTLIAIRMAGGVIALTDPDRMSFPVVLKPRFGSGGKGVRMLSSYEEWLVVLDQNRGGADFIVQECLTNHPYSELIAPQSLNTIRILTVRASKGSASRVYAATHRFGTARSAPVDNASLGGFMADVGLSDGILTNLTGVTPLGRFDSERHPETNAVVADVRVPFWSECLDLATTAMEAVPEARHVGWDVAVTFGGPILIEGNGNPDVGLHQSRGGVLDGDLAKFYRESGVTRSRFVTK